MGTANYTRLTTPVRRRLPVRDGERDLVVIVTHTGIRLRGHRTKRELFVPWEKVAAGAELPPHMPAKYVGMKLKWLVST